MRGAAQDGRASLRAQAARASLLHRARCRSWCVRPLWHLPPPSPCRHASTPHRSPLPRPSQSAWLLDAGLPNSSAASIAKLYASEHVQRCVAECVQIHGGIGFSNACIASKLYRDARILTIYEGASDVQRLIVSRDMFTAAGFGRMA